MHSLLLFTSCLLLFLGAEALGGLVLRHSSRLRALDVFAGIGCIIGWLNLAGVMGMPLSCAAVLLLLLLVYAAWSMTIREGWQTDQIVISLACALPMLLVAVNLPATRWDDLTHWLPNSLYLWKFDAFPVHGMPRISQWSSYPYGIPLLIWLISSALREFQESAGAVLNVLALAFFARFMGCLISPSRPLFAIPLAFALLIFLGPVFDGSLGFDPRTFFDLSNRMCWYAHDGFVFSSHSDSMTSIAFGVTLYAVGSCFYALRRNEALGAWAVQGGLCTIWLVMIRQTGIVMAGLIWSGLLLVNARAIYQCGREKLQKIAPLFVIPLVVWGAWRLYVFIAKPGTEKEFTPFSTWKLENIKILGFGLNS